MNPVDHPHGGGEGRTSGGRHPVSPWGQPEGRTRKKETWLGYHVVEDNILTDFESQQLEWDGRIDFPAEVLNV